MAAKAKPSPRKQRLKVFRTAIGFHDAYVAVPSRKAALEAWGTDKDLFARGVAEEVTEPGLMAEPLGAPGTVFRQMRTMPAEEPEALPRKGAAAKTPKKAKPSPPMRAVPPPPPPTPPTTGEVDEAQAALDAAGEQHAAEERDLAARERELAKERRATETRQAREQQLLERKLKEAQQDYEARLEAWRKAVSSAAG